VRSDIVPGGIFPDYELPDHTGKVRKLSELQGEDPIILTLAAANYLRTFRPKFPILYSKDEKFPIPGFKVLRHSPQDKVTVIGAGVTLHEALKAAEQLKAEGTALRVIDLYCVKPIDGKELAKEIAATGGRLITVEDHWAEGGNRRGRPVRPRAGQRRPCNVAAHRGAGHAALRHVG
jgi:hypothetical protein